MVTLNMDLKQKAALSHLEILLFACHDTKEKLNDKIKGIKAHIDESDFPKEIYIGSIEQRIKLLIKSSRCYDPCECEATWQNRAAYQSRAAYLLAKVFL